MARVVNGVSYPDAVGSVRNGGQRHRTAVTAADKLATPALPTLAGATIDNGALVSGTTYKAAVAAGNRWGASVASAVASGSPGGSNNAERITQAQIAGAEWYDVFLSTDAAPKWVGRVTEAERAAGVAIDTVGVVGGDDDNAIATAIRAALAADTDVGGFFTITGSGVDIVATAKTKAANDATLNIAMADGTSVGVTAAPTSANTTAGVAPVLQVETATIAGAISGAGNATVVVTASGMSNSPKTVSVAVADGDTAAQIATKVRAALTADVDVSAFFTVSGATTAVILTAITKAANDGTLNVSSADGTSHGITTAATSANTTAGVAPVAQVETATIAGAISGAGNATVTVTAAGMSNSPKAVSVAVAQGDSASTVGGKIRTALAADSDVGGFFTISGATTAIILTAKTKAANDATLNVAIANNTSGGITPAPTSANTTAGVAPVAQAESITVAGLITTGGNAVCQVTAAGMTGSPKNVVFAVALADTAQQIATKARAALTADVNVGAFFTVGGSGDGITITAQAAAANDATMNLSIDNSTTIGITPVATSTHTTAGVAGTAQVETATAAGTVAGDGNATITVTAAGMTNSPKAVSVAVADADSAATVAGKVRTALAADTDVNGFFAVSGASAAVILTARATAANDATLNIASTNGTCRGLTPAATSADTTAGVAGTAQVETATIVSSAGITGAGNATIVVTASGMTGSPETVSVAVANLDNASAVAGKVRTALAANAHVAAFFTVGGSGATAALTVKTAAANDATLNIASDNGTCFGLTTTATSANTTAGVAGTAQVETASVPTTAVVSVSGNATVTVTAAGMPNSPKAVSVAVSGTEGVAGKIDVLDVGTGVACTAAPFAVNSSYLAAQMVAGGNVSPINCAGWTTAYVHLKLSVTDLRSAPTLVVVPFWQSASSPTDWFAGAPVTISLLGGAGQTLEQELIYTVNGAPGFAMLVDTITGQGASLDIWVELAG